MRGVVLQRSPQRHTAVAAASYSGRRSVVQRVIIHDLRLISPLNVSSRQHQQQTTTITNNKDKKQQKEQQQSNKTTATNKNSDKQQWQKTTNNSSSSSNNDILAATARRRVGAETGGSAACRSAWWAAAAQWRQRRWRNPERGFASVSPDRTESCTTWGRVRICGGGSPYVRTCDGPDRISAQMLLRTGRRGGRRKGEDR